MDVYTARQVYRERWTGHPLEHELQFKKDQWFMTREEQAYWVEQLRAYRVIWEDKHPYWNVQYGSLQS